MIDYGYNSPFEECALSEYLNGNGVPAVYLRAIYMTGTLKQEPVEDDRRYLSHELFKCPDGLPVLNRERNYITIRGYLSVNRRR